MTDVEEVEAAVRPDDGPSVVAPELTEREQAAQSIVFWRDSEAEEGLVAASAAPAANSTVSTAPQSACSIARCVS